MKLQLTRTDGLHTFTAYGEGHVSVNGTRHEQNVIVLPDRVIPKWTDASFESLTAADFKILAKLDAEIILFGTGTKLRFPRPDLMRPLIEVQKGLEVMDIAGACRTYNILVGEGRKVAAGLIFS